jgi:hypothetical protein
VSTTSWVIYTFLESRLKIFKRDAGAMSNFDCSRYDHVNEWRMLVLRIGTSKMGHEDEKAKERRIGLTFSSINTETSNAE